MSIEQKIGIIDSALKCIRLAILGKGQTPSGDITTYADAISNISGGGEPVLQNKTFAVGSTTPTETVLEPDSGYDGLSSATLNMNYIKNELNAISGSSTSGGPKCNAVGSLSTSGVLTNLSKLELSVSFPDITKISMDQNETNCEYFRFEDIRPGSTDICFKSVEFPNLTEISFSGSSDYDSPWFGGMFQYCSGVEGISFPKLRTIYNANCVFQYAYENVKTAISETPFPSLETIMGRNCFTGAFESSSILRISFPSLLTIEGECCFSDTFYSCNYLKSVSFPLLRSISGERSFSCAFQGCPSLSSINFSSLAVINSNEIFQSAFYACSSLSSLSFPSLTSDSFGEYDDQFNNMLSDVMGCVVHFPSNLQSVIGEWSDVTDGFGGINTTVLFDLEATT